MKESEGSKAHISEYDVIRANLGIFIFAQKLYLMENKDRLMSLDTLRGLDMMFILGLAAIISKICGLFPGGEDSWLATQMSHVDWEGLRHHDTIFPLFLFIAGVSYPFSLSKQKERGFSRGRIYGKIFYRGAMLVFLGIVYNGLLNFDFANLRWQGVLQHIGMAWMFAALLFINFRGSVRAVIACCLLLGYWLLLRFVPAPDFPGSDPFSMEGCLVGFVDRMVMPGRLYDGIFDPEGMLSIIPATVTAMLGMFTGELLKLPEEKISGNKKTLIMLGAAALMLGVGLLWSLDFPIIKKIWSSSFVLVAGSYSLACMAVFYWVIDVKGWKGWTLPFRVVGMNSITIYFAKRVIDLGYTDRFFLGGLASHYPPEVGSLILTTGSFLLCWLICWFCYRQKIFLKV